jgi:hypothetical protein
MDADQSVRELGEAITAELAAIPIEHWIWWAPTRIAVWRFVHRRRPDVLGDLVAHIGDSVELWGTGADWFSELEARDDYLDCIDRLTRQALDGLPAAAIERGFARASELPAPDRDLVICLLTTIDTALAGPRYWRNGAAHG